MTENIIAEKLVKAEMSNFPPNVSAADWNRYCRQQDEEPLSDCCGAELLGCEEDPICSACHEHCDVHEYDE